MNILISVVLSMLIAVMVLPGCSEGLAPLEAKLVKPGPALLTGFLRFKGGADNWKLSQDSAIALRVVAFKTYPPKNIIEELINGNAFFILSSLPMQKDSVFYELPIPEAPVDLRYIVVALQYSSVDINKQRAIGVYSVTGDNSRPSPLGLLPGDTARADIMIDFANLPPQPF